MGRETLEPQELLEEEDLERSRERSLRTRVAVTAAILAVLASLSALQAERTAAESILSKNEAVLAQSRASDEWAYRQAKSIKLHLQELAPGGPTDVERQRADIAASEERAFADHLFAHAEAGEDLHQAVDLRAHLDRARLETAVLAAHQHAEALPVGEERVRGHDRQAEPGRRLERDACEHGGLQEAVGVGHRAAYRERAGRVVDHVADRRQRARELLRVGIDAHRHPLPGLEERELPLGHAHHHPHAREVGDHDQRLGALGARLHADQGLALDDRAGEGRAQEIAARRLTGRDPQALELRACAREVGGGLLGVLLGLKIVLLGDRLRGAEARGTLGRLARQPQVGVGAHVVGLGGLHLGALERDERLIGVDAVAHLDEQLDDAPRDRGGEARGVLLVELDRAAQVGETRGLDLGDGREFEERELRGGETALGGGRRALDRLLTPAGRQGRPRKQDVSTKPHGDTSIAAARVTSKAAVLASRSAARCSRSVCTYVRSASRNSSSDTAPSRNDTSAACRASPAWRRKASSKRPTRSRAIA